MCFQIAADILVLLHLAFILFVVLGGLLVLRLQKLALLHIPAVLWGAFIEFTGRICPITPIEIRLRALSGGQDYSGSFIDHYIMALIYPPGLSTGHQYMIGALVLIINGALYARLLLRMIHGRRHPGDGARK